MMRIAFKNTDYRKVNQTNVVGTEILTQVYYIF